MATVDKAALGKRRGAAGAGNLTPEVIVAAALALIDDEGLDTFSMRTLATRLGSL